MRERGVIIGAFLVFGIAPLASPAQHLTWKNGVPLCALTDSAGRGKPILRGRIIQTLDYAFTLSGSLFFNWKQDAAANNFLLLQDLSYECLITSGKHFSLTKKLLHQLGFQIFPDSLSMFHTDFNTLDIRLAWNIRNTHGVFFSALFSSRLLNGYTFSTDSASHPVKTLNAGFLTPLTATLAGGIQFVWPTLGSMQIGLSGAKLTWIRDKRVYASQGVTLCHGVDITQKYLLEYGFSLQLQTKKTLAKWIAWDCDLMIFKDINKPVDVSFRNLFTINMTRFLKTMIQTRVFYEEQVSQKIQVENVISLGIALHL